MFCDLIGIGATKLNSALLVAALGDAAPQEIPESYADAARLAERPIKCRLAKGECTRDGFFREMPRAEALGKILLVLDQNPELKCLNSSVLQFS